MNLGVVAAQQGDLETARREFGRALRKAVALDASSPEAQHALGLVLCVRARLEEGLKALALHDAGRTEGAPAVLCQAWLAAPPREPGAARGPRSAGPRERDGRAAAEYEARRAELRGR